MLLASYRCWAMTMLRSGIRHPAPAPVKLEETSYQLNVSAQLSSVLSSVFGVQLSAQHRLMSVSNFDNQPTLLDRPFAFLKKPEAAQVLHSPA